MISFLGDASLVQLLVVTIVAVLVGAHPVTAVGWKWNGRKCNNDPKQVVLDLIECVQNNDAVCVASAYDPTFVHIHNEKIVPLPTKINESEFWDGIFTIFPQMEFDITLLYNINSTVAIIRYVERLTSTNGTNLAIQDTPRFTYPFNQTIIQHEHAMVHVINNNKHGCKLIKWDQYGDNQEQTAVNPIATALFSYISKASKQ